MDTRVTVNATVHITYFRLFYLPTYLPIIMHRDVTLVANKRSNKLKYLKLEERTLKTAKEVVIQF